MSLADGLRQYFLLLVAASLLAIITVAIFVFVLDVSRLWLIAGALVIGAVEITVIAIATPPSESQLVGEEQPLPVYGGPSVYA